MSNFDKWCVLTSHKAGARTVQVLAPKTGALSIGVDCLADNLSDHYASRERLAKLLKRLGKKKVAAYLSDKYPITPKIRSGDLGEILGSNWIDEYTRFRVCVKRLRWKDHRDQAMRGDDLLAVEVPSTGPVHFLKGEVKSAASLSNSTIAKARKALRSNLQRPTSHALSFVIDRLDEQGETDLVDKLDDATLKGTIKLAQVTHLMFVFTGNDPKNLLTTDLTAYTGTVKQLSVGLHVKNHQDFIKDVYEGALAYGL